MNANEIVEWCAVGIGPCWTRGEWITVWSSFGGVAIAFALGALSQIAAKRREKRSAYRFLEKTLLKSLDAFSFFDDQFRKIGNEDQIGLAFGGLGHAAAAVKWASAHPEKFDLDFFIDLLKIEDRVVSAGHDGPSMFDGPNFVIDASNHLHRTVVPIANDIKFLLRLH